MKEVWKLVEGYPNHMVSNFGNMKKLKKEGWVEQPILYWEGNGYEMVYLYKPKGKGRKEYLHRCVAKAFVNNPDPERYNSVIHKDGNTTNNAAKNLFWGNQKLNMELRLKRGNYYSTNKIKKTNSKLVPRDIPNIILLKTIGVKIADIARMFEVLPCTISSILDGKTWKHLKAKQ